jgi:DNA polymerase III delta prime subunit
MSESPNSISKPVILPYQKPIFDRLCTIARACLYVDRKSITALKLRANFLLLGPTGTGKTFLAKEVAREMQVPFLTVSVSDWIILGGSSRGSSVTWPNIVNFIKKNRNKKGAIIFVDELDKCGHDSNWNAFLRSEIFSLCDSRTPLGLNDLDDDDRIDANIEEVESFLSHKTMIIGGAAFQSIWEDQSAPVLGFNPEPSSPNPPQLHDLAKHLPRELINRFSSEIFILPTLTKNDYRSMIETMAENISDTWKKRFLELGLARLDQAVRDQKGARYPEEILLAAIVAERSCMQNWKPECEAPEIATVEPEVPDDQDKTIAIF